MRSGRSRPSSIAIAPPALRAPPARRARERQAHGLLVPAPFGERISPGQGETAARRSCMRRRSSCAGPPSRTRRLPCDRSPTVQAPPRGESARISKTGCDGLIRSGKRVSSSRPSTCVTLSFCPASRAGCRTTKPARLVTKSDCGVATAPKASEPSLDPVMRASYSSRWSASSQIALYSTVKLSCVFLDRQRSRSAARMFPSSDREPERLCREAPRRP